MNLALEKAREAASLGEVPVGAVLVVADQVISGHNRTITDCDPTAHAEMVVIREAARRIGNYRLSESTLYVTLEPCIMCVGAIVQARIGRLVYGTRDYRYGAVESLVESFSLGLNHRPEIETGVLAEESSELLKSFFKARR